MLCIGEITDRVFFANTPWVFQVDFSKDGEVKGILCSICTSFEHVLMFRCTCIIEPILQCCYAMQIRGLARTNRCSLKRTEVGCASA